MNYQGHHDTKGRPQVIPREMRSLVDLAAPVRLYDVTHTGHSAVLALSIVGLVAVVAALLIGWL